MLRDYQARLVDEIMWAFADHSSVVLQLPTGGGKTHIAAEIARTASRTGKRVWFVCHLREIVDQTEVSLRGFGVPHGAGMPVQVWSVDKLRSVVADQTPPDIIVWGECHHLPAPSWSKIKDAVPQAKHLGLTATPARLDGLGLAISSNG